MICRSCFELQCPEAEVHLARAAAMAPDDTEIRQLLDKVHDAHQKAVVAAIWPVRMRCALVSYDGRRHVMWTEITIEGVDSDKSLHSLSEKRRPR